MVQSHRPPVPLKLHQLRIVVRRMDAHFVSKSVVVASQYALRFDSGWAFVQSGRDQNDCSFPIECLRKGIKNKRGRSRTILVIHYNHQFPRCIQKLQDATGQTLPKNPVIPSEKWQTIGGQVIEIYLPTIREH